MTNYNGVDPYSYWEGTPYAQQTIAPAEASPQQHNDMFSYPQNYQNALMLIRQAVAGETEDRLFYTWLIEHAPSEADRKIIAGIRENEISHFGYFRRLYGELTGSPVPPVTPEQFVPPSNYCEGLSRALMGEQNAVVRYRQILFAMQARDHFNMLMEIITDELRHGILYNYLYTKNGCRG